MVCGSVSFDQLASVWVCERMVNTSDGDGGIPVLRLPECFGLISVCNRVLLILKNF